MLEMRPDCERCGTDLPADAPGAFICSFECTYCAPCAEALDDRCPNCGGELMDRPTRMGKALANNPASTERKFKGMTPARILIIAGSDSGGGAGIQADIKTVTMLGGHAMTAITAITAQNTRGVQGVHPVPTEMVLAQMESCIADIGVDAVKIGMIGSAETAAAVAERLALLEHVPIIFDPVMVATSGSLLADEATIAAFKRLMQVATVITPNVPELAALTGRTIDDVEQLEEAAQALREKTGAVIFAKGGHLPQAPDDDRPLIHDLLVDEDMVAEYSVARIETRHNHGTGCTLASAIATGLGRGLSLADAVDRAEAFVAAVLKAAPGLGQGHGPMGHALGHTPFYHLLAASEQNGWEATDFAARYSDHA